VRICLLYSIVGEQEGQDVRGGHLVAQSEIPNPVPKSTEENRQVLGLQLFVGLMACVVALIIFGLLLSNVINAGGMVLFDQNLTLAVHVSANPATTQFFHLISMLGFEGLLVVVFVVGLYYLSKRRWSYLITWAAGYAGAQVLNAILKLMIARPRPVFEDPLAVAANYSFPSGHAMMSLVMYGLLAFFMMVHIRNVVTPLLITVTVVVLVILIGYSRIYLGVHFFSDIVAGYAAGIIWLTICIMAMGLFKERQLAMARRRTASANES
jgi:membrane-associated phospholipid phosphatase